MKLFNGFLGLGCEDKYTLVDGGRHTRRTHWAAPPLQKEPSFAHCPVQAACIHMYKASHVIVGSRCRHALK